MCSDRERVCGEIERGSVHGERSRFVKIKNIKKRSLLYGCFKNNPHKR